MNRILSAVIAVLAVTIISGTAAAFLLKKAEPGKDLRAADPAPGEAVKLNHGGGTMAAYTELGTIRAVTRSAKNGENGISIVITPWLAYPEGDAVFFEELMRKRLVITGIFTDYFSSRTKQELLAESEDKIKAELLDSINSRLTLGKINKVYFTDYIFLE